MSSAALADRLSSNINLSSFSKAGELKRKIFFVIFMLIAYRVGTYVPLPGINALALQELANSQAGGVLGMFNMFTGGALGRMSIFALNIMPFITASIIMQLMTVVSTELAAMKKEGEQGRKKINQFTRYLTVILALFQGYGMSVGMEAMTTGKGSVVMDPGLFFRITSMVSLAGGTILVMWIAEQITQRGIGNGSSLIISKEVVERLPAAMNLPKVFDQVMVKGRSKPVQIAKYG